MGRIRRSDQIQASEICMVHAVQRCVRGSFLTGKDPRSGKDYSYRRDWIRRRMEALSSTFCIDVIAYTVLSNHLHIALRNRPDVVAALSDEQVAIRWLRVFPGKRLEEHLAEPSEADVQALISDPQRLAEVRSRLSDISWYMRALAETIARRANREDECTGRFWEGRFKTTRIVDEAGLLACAMYIDLNPLRAAMANHPAAAVFTSAYDRHHAEQGAVIDSAAFDLVPVATEKAAKEIRDTPVDQLRSQRHEQRRCPTGRQVRRDAWLARLTLDRAVLSSDPQVHTDGLRASDKGFLNLEWAEYWQLLCWTARQGTATVVDQMPEALAKCLEKLGINVSKWRELIWGYQKHFGTSGCVGSAASMVARAKQLGKRWQRGQRAAAKCFLDQAATAAAAADQPLPASPSPAPAPG